MLNDMHLALWLGSAEEAFRLGERLERMSDSGGDGSTTKSLRRHSEQRICRALAATVVKHLQFAGKPVDVFRHRNSHVFSGHQMDSGAALGTLGTVDSTLQCHLDLAWIARPATPVLPLARRAFTATEADMVGQLSDSKERRLLFAHIWTLREALAKATRMGMAQARKRLQLKWSGARWQLTMDGKPAPDWHWRHFQPVPGLLLAVVWCGQAQLQTWAADAELRFAAAEWEPSDMDGFLRP